MKKNSFFYCISIVYILLMLSGCSSSGYVIKLSQQELQERLEENFPIEKDYLVVFTAKLLNPEIILQEGSDRVDFSIQAKTNIADIQELPLQGNGRISGKVRYEPRTGEFFVDKAKIEDLSLGAFPEKYRKPLRIAISLGVRELLRRHPIYTLRPDKFKHAVARMVVEEVVVKNGVLTITLDLIP